MRLLRQSRVLSMVAVVAIACSGSTDPWSVGRPGVEQRRAEPRVSQSHSGRFRGDSTGVGRRGVAVGYVAARRVRQLLVE